MFLTYLQYDCIFILGDNMNDNNFISEGQARQRNMNPIDPHKNENLFTGYTSNIERESITPSVPEYNPKYNLESDENIPESVKNFYKKSTAPAATVTNNATKKSKPAETYKKVVAILTVAALSATAGYFIHKYGDKIREFLGDLEIQDDSQVYVDESIHAERLASEAYSREQAEAASRDAATDPWKEISSYMSEIEAQNTNPYGEQDTNGRSR